MSSAVRGGLLLYLIGWATLIGYYDWREQSSRLIRLTTIWSFWQPPNYSISTWIKILVEDNVCFPSARFTSLNSMSITWDTSTYEWKMLSFKWNLWLTADPSKYLTSLRHHSSFLQGSSFWYRLLRFATPSMQQIAKSVLTIYRSAVARERANCRWIEGPNRLI